MVLHFNFIFAKKGIRVIHKEGRAFNWFAGEGRQRHEMVSWFVWCVRSADLIPPPVMEIRFTSSHARAKERDFVHPRVVLSYPHRAHPTLFVPTIFRDYCTYTITILVGSEFCSRTNHVYIWMNEWMNIN